MPRHAERREEISATLTASGFTFNLRTRKRKAEAGTIVYLADTTGELFRLIRVADLAFIGKTLPPNGGGQNPIEPVSLAFPSSSARLTKTSGRPARSFFPKEPP